MEYCITENGKVIKRFSTREEALKYRKGKQINRYKIEWIVKENKYEH